MRIFGPLCQSHKDSPGLSENDIKIFLDAPLV